MLNSCEYHRENRVVTSNLHHIPIRRQYEPGLRCLGLTVVCWALEVEMRVEVELTQCSEGCTESIQNNIINIHGTIWFNSTLHKVIDWILL